MPSICISHKEDVDGLCSAALVKTAFDISKIVLVDYANLISRLEKVAAMLEKIEQLFICDLGLSKKNEQKFTELLHKIVSTGAEVIYIDHHDISRETLHALKKAQACRFIQSTRKSSRSMLHFSQQWVHSLIIWRTNPLHQLQFQDLIGSS